MRNLRTYKWEEILEAPKNFPLWPRILIIHVQISELRVNLPFTTYIQKMDNNDCHVPNNIPHNSTTTTRERGVLSSVLDIMSFKYRLLSKV